MSVELLGTKWLEIDLGQLGRNLDLIAEKVKPAWVLPVIKANAYGHGLVPIARFLEKRRHPWLAVATLDEAVTLRRDFVKTGLLLLGAVPESEIPDLLNYSVAPTVCTLPFARALSVHARSLGLRASCHVYVDTGMGRMGMPVESAQAEWPELSALPGLKIESIYSHFAVADEQGAEDVEYTRGQWQRLRTWVKTLLKPPPVHLCNSGGVLAHPYAYGDAVRPGLLCYGVSPFADRRSLPGIAPVMTLKCRPLFTKQMAAGESVGYGRAYRLPCESRIMTLPVGYADGVPRRLGPHLKVAVNGRLMPVVGRICMDMMMVDLGLDEVAEGSEVTLMGGEAQSIYDWAAATGNIPYELLTGMGNRWTRCYTDGNRLIDVIRPAS